MMISPSSDKIADNHIDSNSRNMHVNNEPCHSKNQSSSTIVSSSHLARFMVSLHLFLDFWLCQGDKLRLEYRT